MTQQRTTLPSGTSVTFYDYGVLLRGTVVYATPRIVIVQSADTGNTLWKFRENVTPAKGGQS